MKRTIVINPEYAALQEPLLHVKDFFDQSDESIHKARNELRISRIEGEKTVIKAFKIPHLFNRIVYGFFRKSKAYKSYHNALKLLALNIATPAPIALIEERHFGLFGESYFVAAFEPYDFTIREALHHKIEDHQEVIKAFTAFTFDLHQKGIWHVDYSPGNILVRRSEKGYFFSLVDINRMDFMSVSAEKGCENFSKLWAKEDDLRLMADEYAKLSGLEPERCYELMVLHVRHVTQKKAFKKKIKGN